MVLRSFKVSYSERTASHLKTLRAPVKVLATILIARMEDIAPVFLTAGLRTPEEQHHLYMKGRKGAQGPKEKIVTNAQAGESWHNWGRAFDVAFQGKDPFSESHPWGELGACGTSLGLTWGGNWQKFPDRPHFHRRGPFSRGLLTSVIYKGNYLGVGARGPWIEGVQRGLTICEFPLTADGIFGPKTEQGLFDYQEDRWMLTDGMLNHATLQRLRSDLDDIEVESLP